MIEIVGWIALIIFGFSLFFWTYVNIMAAEAFFEVFDRKSAIKLTAKYVLTSIWHYFAVVSEGWTLFHDKEYAAELQKVLVEGLKKIKDSGEMP